MIYHWSNLRVHTISNISQILTIFFHLVFILLICSFEISTTTLPSTMRTCSSIKALWIVFMFFFSVWFAIFFDCWDFTRIAFYIYLISALYVWWILRVLLTYVLSERVMLYQILLGGNTIDIVNCFNTLMIYLYVIF